MNNQINIHKQTIINTPWSSLKKATDFSFVFAFRNKEQYLDFRRLWKDNYAALSNTIRARKYQIKETMRKHEYAGNLQNDLRGSRKDATIQLLMLEAAKQEAQRQYLAAKQTAK